MRMGYIVDISYGLFRDKVVSLKPTAEAAITEGMAWYHGAAAEPVSNPHIEAHPIMILDRKA